MFTVRNIAILNHLQQALIYSRVPLPIYYP